MPKGSGGNSSGRKGFGRKEGRNQQGNGNYRTGGGPDGNCVCPQCGATAAHKRGIPCFEMICPDCGTNMTRK